ncbi:MAG: RNA-directed DNA polymerase [Treponema sp.]|nr:RNA-directed DNA polymerase [Treponema sp.]
MLKSYFNCLSEISPDELYDGLLGYGLFTDKLPPIFTSEAFCIFSKQEAQIKHGYKDEASAYVYFESNRNVNLPRPYGIPNPFAYEKLCKHLKKYWENILIHFENQVGNQPYKVSRIHIRKIKDTKKLFEMNYDNWKIDGDPQDDLIIGKRYIATSDISTCFQSIYTHSIPWALLGKEKAKKEKDDNSLWENQLDHYCQNTTNGETHGLLIGPHASNLLSEIILTCVDRMLMEKDYTFVRHIDDYICYTENYEKAESFISDLNSMLRFYGLPLNLKKTSISNLPSFSKDYWKVRIKSFTPQNKYFDYNDVMRFLNLLLDLMQTNNNNSAVFNYGIKFLANQTLSENGKVYFVKQVFHLAIIYPYLIQILDECIFEKFNIDKNLFSNFINCIYDNGLQNNNYEESYYAIYFAIKYNLIIDKFNIDCILKIDSCLLKIFSWIYVNKQNNHESIKKLQDHAEELSLNSFQENWLFCYEVLKENKLKDDWKRLKTNKISFIKPNFKV